MSEISAEQLESTTAEKCPHYHGVPGTWVCLSCRVERVNALIAPLIQSARVNAMAAMRDACANEAEASSPMNGLLADRIRALPLATPEAEDWLRRVIDTAIEWGAKYGQREDKILTRESILREASKR